MKVPTSNRQALSWAANYLEQHGIESPALEAEVLLLHVRGWDRVRLYQALEAEVDPRQWRRFRRLVELRSRRWPTAYLIRRKEFMGLDFIVTPDVLVPRPETEVLVETGLRLIDEMWKKRRGAQGGPLRIIDIGTGSGAIILSLAKYAQAPLELWGTDVSPAALGIAKENCLRLGLAGRINWVQAGWLEGLGTQEWDLVISNPPYIPGPQLDRLAPEVKREPRMALDGGPDGLKAHRILIPQASEALRAQGWLALEIGWDQAQAVSAIVGSTVKFGEAIVIKDYAQRDRVIMAQRRSRAVGNF